MTARGFDIPESDHPIVPVMIGDAVEAAAMADRLLADGIYVRAFSFPVVPRGKARIRTQMSAAHTRGRPGPRHRGLRAGPVDACPDVESGLRSTISLPSGIRAIGISLKFAMAIGMPMIVMHKAMPVTMWVSAIHQPATINQMMLPSSANRPEVGRSITSRPNGQAA